MVVGPKNETDTCIIFFCKMIIMYVIIEFKSALYKNKIIDI